MVISEARREEQEKASKEKSSRVGQIDKMRSLKSRRRKII